MACKSRATLLIFKNLVSSFNEKAILFLSERGRQQRDAGPREAHKEGEQDGSTLVMSSFL
jgi:hypothetical protein